MFLLAGQNFPTGVANGAQVESKQSSMQVSVPWYFLLLPNLVVLKVQKHTSLNF